MKTMCMECNGSGISQDADAMTDQHKACEHCGGSGYIETERD